MTGRQEELLRTRTASSGPALEIACDESGYEGEKLIGTTTDVFAHASVALDMESARRFMQDLRDRIRSPATEYKAGHVLREKHRAVLEWLLGPTGPVHGTAHVYLIDKAFYVIGKIVDLLVAGVTNTAGVGPVELREAGDMAVTLYREGPRVFGREQWLAFLVSANNLMRVKDRLDVRTSVDSFYRIVAGLRRTGPPGGVDEILALLEGARPRAESFRAQLFDDQAMMSMLDPLIPAITQAVIHWGDGGAPVSIFHDQQNMLSPERVVQLKRLLGGPLPGRSPDGGLVDLALVDSSSDARVQVADILAGAVRKIASDELNDRGDAQLTALLAPYVDSSSVWGDDRSWSLLRPAAAASQTSEGQTR